MGEFFKGWRRKLGVLTLLMACAITSIWLFNSSTSFAALPRRIQFAYESDAIKITVDETAVTPVSVTRVVKAEDGSASTITTWEPRIIVIGSQHVTAPYLTVVLPLALLSAYLLLVKPRIAKPTKAVELTSAEGT